MAVDDTDILGPSTIRIIFSGRRHVALSFCNRGVFQVFRSGRKNVIHSPRTSPRTRVLMSHPQGRINRLSLASGSKIVAVSATEVRVRVSGHASLFGVASGVHRGIMIRSTYPISFVRGRIYLSLGTRSSRCFCKNNMRGNHFSRGKGDVHVIGAGR